MRILGIDYGSARIGVALGDTDSRLASALLVIQEKTPVGALERVCALAQEEGIDTIVVGVPHVLHDPTMVTEQMTKIRQFIHQLRERGFHVEEADETWSSKQAMQHVHDRGERGKRDDLAASIILQSWLDRS